MVKTNLTEYIASPSWKNMMKYCFLLAALLFSSPRATVAQTIDPATQELIQKLLSRVDTLEKRVAELENEKVPSRPTPAPTAYQAPEALHDHDAAPQTVNAEAAQPTYPSLKLSGFADFDFGASDLRGASGGFQYATLLNTHSGFEEGQFTLHFSSALSPRVSFFGELTLTPRTDAGNGTPPPPGFNPEVERAIIRFSQSDYLKVSFGRYHTPINYWNTAFHHGQWLQTTISRPEMTEFGGSFIPVHFVGTLVEGAVPAGGLNVNYNLGLGNGRSSVISRAGDFGDINNDKAWLVNAFIRPDALDKLQVGGSVYRDEINPVTGPPSREWIQSANLVWHSETPEFIGEFANVKHQPVNGSLVTSNSQAFYAQTAYRLPWNQRLWKPYYRFEYIHVPHSDVIFRAVPSFSASTAGLRYDISTFAAFKLEYRHYERRGLPPINGAFSQVSFTF
jgi:hypothetical protein